MKTRSKNTAKGFTLIELLVAMAITTIIISILVSVTALSLDAWNRSRSEVRAARQGKAMIDSMARDFESFVVRKGNGFEWLHAESNPSTGGPNGSASPSAVDMIFFTAATDRYDGNVGDTGPTGQDKGGDVSTVGYQLVYKDPIDPTSTDDGFKTFVLYRKLLDPDKTFGVGGTPGTLGEADLKDAFTTVIGSNLIDEDVNFICENVYEFTVTMNLSYTEGAITKSLRIPIGQGDNAVRNLSIKGTGITQNDGTLITGVNGASNSAVDGELIKSAQLSSVEISLTVLSDFGLKQLRVRTFADADEKSEFIAKNSYQYSKLVQVPGS